ncbi:tRNA dihydrouridine synthase DusB, partial [Mycobacterium tuberculosis]|nr:tRNA dihydrouridine synthase DusB [Mycobacterium tuberculosis]
LDALLAELDDAPYPGEAAEGSRGRTTRPKRPHLPEGWRDSRGFDASGTALLAEAELDISGG